MFEAAVADLTRLLKAWHEKDALKEPGDNQSGHNITDVRGDLPLLQITLFWRLFWV